MLSCREVEGALEELRSARMSMLFLWRCIAWMPRREEHARLRRRLQNLERRGQQLLSDDANSSGKDNEQKAPLKQD